MSHLFSLLLFCGCTAVGFGRYWQLRRRETLLEQGVWVLARWRVLSSWRVYCRRMSRAVNSALTAAMKSGRRTHRDVKWEGKSEDSSRPRSVRNWVTSLRVL